MRFWLGHMKLDDELAFLERGLPRAGDDGFDRSLASAVGPGDDGGRMRSDQRRHAVGSRRGVAEIAGERGPSLDLFRADQVHALDDPRPSAGQRLVLIDHDPRRRSADHKTVALLPDAYEFR